MRFFLTILRDSGINCVMEVAVEIKNMKATGKSRSSLTMLGMFRAMLEGGYYPQFDKTHITFGHEGNIAIVEYEEGVLSVRLFFTIEEEAYDLFLEASNQSMLETYVVKPVLMDDMKTIMFSCETLCDNLREFRKFFPRCIDLIDESIASHKREMKKLVLAEETVSKTIPASDEWSSLAGTSKSRKILS